LAKAIANVVFPVPPFWVANVIIISLGVGCWFSVVGFKEVC
jgi:hypothetical protein